MLLRIVDGTSFSYSSILDTSESYNASLRTHYASRSQTPLLLLDSDHQTCRTCSGWFSFQSLAPRYCQVKCLNSNWFIACASICLTTSSPVPRLADPSPASLLCCCVIVARLYRILKISSRAAGTSAGETFWRRAPMASASSIA
jgi:hypothetical protein